METQFYTYFKKRLGILSIIVFPSFSVFLKYKKTTKNIEKISVLNECILFVYIIMYILSILHQIFYAT
jgi:hypothetical protein